MFIVIIVYYYYIITIIILLRLFISILMLRGSAININSAILSIVFVQSYYKLAKRES